jgi:hypothetical protein
MLAESFKIDITRTKTEPDSVLPVRTDARYLNTYVLDPEYAECEPDGEIYEDDPEDPNPGTSALIDRYVYGGGGCRAAAPS